MKFFSKNLQAQKNQKLKGENIQNFILADTQTHPTTLADRLIIIAYNY